MCGYLTHLPSRGSAQELSDRVAQTVLSILTSPSGESSRFSAKPVRLCRTNGLPRTAHFLTREPLGRSRCHPPTRRCIPRVADGHCHSHSPRSGGVPCRPTTTKSKHPFEPMSKRRRGFPSETQVKRGMRVVHGDKQLEEKLGRNDLCPCGSGKRFKKCCLEGGLF